MSFTRTHPFGVADRTEVQSFSMRGDQGAAAFHSATEMAAPSPSAVDAEAEQRQRVDPAPSTATATAPAPAPAPSSSRSSAALVALCGADLHDLSTRRSLDTHPLLREEPPHIAFNPIPMLVMGSAWLAQLPLLLLPDWSALLLLPPLAHALALLIVCVVHSWRYPTWVWQFYHGNPLDALMRINTHSNSLVNAEDQLERDGVTNDATAWTNEKVQLAVKLRERAKQKQWRREQIQLEDKVQQSEKRVEQLKLQQQRYSAGERAGMRRDPTSSIAEQLEKQREQRARWQEKLNRVNECMEEQSLFADYKLVPTYFSVFFVVGFVVLSALIAASNFHYSRSVVLPCVYSDSVSQTNTTVVNSTQTVLTDPTIAFNQASFRFQLVNVTSSDPADPSACLVAQSVRFTWIMFWALVMLVQLTLAWHVTSKQDAEMRASQLQLRLVVEPRLMAQIVHFIKAQHWDKQTLPSDPWRQAGAIALALLVPLVQLAVMPQLIIDADWPGRILYVAALPIGCLAAYSIQYMLYGLSIIYWRNQRYMLMCTRLMERFNLIRCAELLFSWWHVRELFRRVLMPVGYSLGAWGLTSLLLLTVTAILVVVVIIFVAPAGIRVFLLDPTLVLFLALAVIALIILFRILIHAVSVYGEQQKHVEAMQRALLVQHDDIALRLRTHFTQGGTETGEEAQAEAEAESAGLLEKSWVPLSALPPAPHARSTRHPSGVHEAAPVSAAAGAGGALAGLRASSFLNETDPMRPLLDLYADDSFFGTLRFVHALSRGYLWPEVTAARRASQAASDESCQGPGADAALPASPTAGRRDGTGADQRRDPACAGEGAAAAGCAVTPGLALGPGVAATQKDLDALDRRELQLKHASQEIQRQKEQSQLHPSPPAGPSGPSPVSALSLSSARAAAAAPVVACAWGPEEQRAVVSSFITLIRESDTFPTVLGIPIKPTLLQLVSGYVISAAALVAGKFIAQIGF